MFIKKYHVLRKISCSSKNIMFVKKYHVHRKISCSSKNIMFFGKYHVLRKISCSSENIMFFEKYHVHRKISENYFYICMSSCILKSIPLMFEFILNTIFRKSIMFKINIMRIKETKIPKTI